MANTTVRKRRSSANADVWRRLKMSKAARIGTVIIVLFALSAICAPLLTPYGYADQDLNNTFAAPSAEHLLGTDDLGRDTLTRILYGGRISMSVGIVAVTISLSIGGTLGAIAGFYGGLTDDIIMRIMDIMMAIPSTLLALVVVSTLGPGIFNLMLAVGISNIPSFARIVRASTLSIGKTEYVEAARLTGCGDAHIIVRHVIPNCLATILVNATMRMAFAILAACALSFLGLGVQPPVPEWGAMLSSARQFLGRAPILVVYPGVAIVCTILGFNMLGDGLRDALDPRLKN